MGTWSRILGIAAVGSAAVVAGGGAVSSARADSVFTPVSTNPNEASVRSILNHTLGGSFVKNGLNYSNGAVNVVRVSDDDDKFWSGKLTDLNAAARFAAFSQSFGYLPGATGGSFVELFKVTGSGYNVAGGIADVDLGDVARLARSGKGKTYTSDPTSNHDKLDHMITYRVVPAVNSLAQQGGGKPKNHYLFFFEDLPYGGDKDYNDLVVEAYATAVPVPAAVWGGAALMSMLGVRAWRRKRASA